MNGRRLLSALALFLAAPAAAQRGTEWQVGPTAVLQRQPYLGAGGGWSRRDARVRLTVAASGGWLDGRAAGRGEVVLGYLLTPGRRRGLGLYAGGGAAVLVTGQGHDERLVAVLGVETAPASRGGWFAEVGVGGGVRFAMGWRWRHLRR